MAAPTAQPNRRSSAAPYVGALIGLGIWGLALVGALTLDRLEPAFPQWARDLDLVDTVGSICTAVANPIGIAGYFWFWGEKGPPHPWMESWTFYLISGLCLAVFLGAVVGQVVSLLTRPCLKENRTVFDKVREEPENESMSERHTTTDDVEADSEALIDALEAGKEPDPELVKRIQERAERARQELFQRVGYLDIGVPTLREDRNRDS